MRTMSQFATHYDLTLQLFRDGQDAVIDFGHSALVDINEGKTIRQMSIDLCGNTSLEDKISRYVMAAQWDRLIEQGNGILYEAARTWLTPSHFTTLYQISQRYDVEYAHDLMEQCLVRTGTEITEARPVEWLRSKLQDPGSPSVATRRHNFWRAAAKYLLDLQSELERLGNLATTKDRRELFLVSLVVKRFNASEKVEA